MSEFQSIIIYLKDQEDAIKFDLSNDVSFFDVLEQVEELGWFVSKNFAIPLDNISHIERIADIDEEEQEEEQGEDLAIDFHNYTVINDWDVYTKPVMSFEVTKPKFDNHLKEMTGEELEAILKDERESNENKDKVLDELNRRKKEGKNHD